MGECMNNIRLSADSNTSSPNSRISFAYWYWAPALLVVMGIFTLSTGYMALAGFSYFVLLFGLINKKNKYLHVRLMSAAISLDLFLVLLLEVQRHAIETTIENNLSNLQRAHIYSSSLAVVLYIPVIILGYRLYNKMLASRKWHIRLGVLAFLFRTLGFIMMFSLIEYVKN